MPVSIAQSPGPINWTKNSINFGFTYSLMTLGWKLEIRLKDFTTNAIIARVELPFNGTSGSMSYDIKAICDPYPVFATPAFLTALNSDNTQDISQHRRRVYIDFKPVGTGAPTTYTSSSPFYIVKGGIGEMTVNELFVNNNVILNPTYFFPYGQKFLTWIPPHSTALPGRRMTPNEWGWLGYMSTTDIGQQYVRYVIHTVATASTFIQDKILNGSIGTGNLYKMWLIPMGVGQGKLDTYNQGIHWVEISIMTGNTVLQGPYRYYIDNRPYYETLTVFFRNSMGCFDHINFKGEIDNTISPKKEETQIGELQPMFYSKSRPSWKANTGWLTKGQVRAFFEIVNSTECYLVHNERLIQVRIPEQTLAWNTKDDLKSAQVTIEAAAEFEIMPRQLTSLI